MRKLTRMNDVDRARQVLVARCWRRRHVGCDGDADSTAKLACCYRVNASDDGNPAQRRRVGESYNPQKTVKVNLELM